MLENPDDKLVVEVRRQKVDVDPPLTIFLVVLSSPAGVWYESYGSEELLTAYLRGITSALGMAGIHASLHPGIAADWQLPSGKRWTISRDSVAVEEDLDDEGNVIKR